MPQKRTHIQYSPHNFLFLNRFSCIYAHLWYINRVKRTESVLRSSVHRGISQSSLMILDSFCTKHHGLRLKSGFLLVLEHVQWVMMDVTDTMKRNEHNNHIYMSRNTPNNTGMSGSVSSTGSGRCVCVCMKVCEGIFLQEIFMSGLENKGEYCKYDQEHVQVIFHTKIKSKN